MSPFVANEYDPLHLFHDGAVHMDCVRRYPLGQMALAMHDALLVSAAPQNRRCSISGQLITNPERYVGMGLLTSDPDDQLYRFNFAQFDLAAMMDWLERKVLAALLGDALTYGRIKGKGIEWSRHQVGNP